MSHSAARYAVKPAPTPMPAGGTTWDVFCRVVDNRGDAGVCWRLSRGLAMAGLRVRLWIDDAAALDGMADDRDRMRVATGQVRIHRWTEAESAPVPTIEVVVETFGGGLPGTWVEALAEATRQAPADGRRQPLWINLEHLSAEAFVERLHRLPSPQGTGIGHGLVSWFFYPGFSTATGGLLRESDLFDARPTDPTVQAWVDGMAARTRLPGLPRPTLRVSRFDYRPRAADTWLRDWAAQPDTPPIHLAQPGCTEPPGSTPRLQVTVLPWLSQSGYDDLLNCCDLNIVRGEDSFVRAQWAARPMLWHIYPQADGAHAIKLHAWLDRYLEGADVALAAAVREAHAVWNGLVTDRTPGPALQHALAWAHGGERSWRAHALRWRDRLASQADLVTQLGRFVDERRA
jgi:uncharacterized repeat protein (TIGR03837 family)